MPFRVACLSADDLLAKAVRDAADVSNGELEVVSAELEAVGADVAVFGAGTTAALRSAQSLARAEPETPILFLVTAGDLEKFRQSLPFRPNLTSAWSAALGERPASLAAILAKAASEGRSRSASKAVVSRINAQIEKTAAAAAADDAERQRVRQQAVSEDYVETLIAQAPDGLVALSLSNTVLAWNHAAAELFGIPAERALGANATEVLPVALAAELTRVFPQVAGGEAVVGRHLGYTDLERSRWVDLALVPIYDDQERVSSLSLTVRDITGQWLTDLRLRASETRLRTLTETLPQLVWTCRPDGSCDYLSRQWVEYTGMDAADQLGLAWLDRVIHPDDRQRTLEHWLGAVSGLHPYDIEYRIRAADGSYRWFKTRGTPIRNEEGDITQWFGTCTDFQEIVEARETLRQDAAELERRVEDEVAKRAEVEEALRQSQKMEAVGQLTGGIAHDFNNLLAGITGSLELLEKRIAQGRLGETVRYLDVAKSSARRAAALTQRLLAFSRRQTLDPRAVDLNRLVAGMSDLIRRSVGPEVVVEVVGAGGLWATKVDPSQLENALLNLCINARDAMSPSGGRLTIETANKWLDDRAARERDLPPGQYVSLCVTDTGTGMAPDVVERVFDPFFTTKPIGQGTGLGLSMVYGFVRQSGGQVRIYSEPGKGTTMCLYLPRSMSEAEGTDFRPPARIDKGDNERVLVVDDEASVRMLIAEVLEESGYAVVEAGDGPAALRILQSEARIDLLITDVGLPGGMNGRQVADAARTSRAGLRVLFITGYAENAAIGNGDLEPGMEIITKPFVMTDLGQKVRDLLDRAAEPVRGQRD